MQTNYKSLADIKKRVPNVSDLHHKYKHAHAGTAKNMPHQLSPADAWIYRIVIIAISAGIIKVIIGVLL